jgi:uncharacterized protein involved in oxidation of intracellular sulfur
MTLLLVLNRKPYDGTDVTWNALRLLEQAQKAGMAVRVFLMNDAVDLAREGLERGADYDLQVMLVDSIFKGAEVKLCKTCITRCGIGEGRIRPEVKIGTIPELVDWIAESDRVLTF